MTECPQCHAKYRGDGPVRRCPCGHGMPKPIGIGDLIEHAIKWVTRGRIKPCGGCRRRRDRLNRLWPFSGGDDAGGTEPRR